MSLLKWEPGLSGLIYLPEEGSENGQKDRPFIIYEIDGEGQILAREGPMRWGDAYVRIALLAAEEGKTAFAWPDRRFAELKRQGYLMPKPYGSGKMNETRKSQIWKNRPKPQTPSSHANTREASPSKLEDFDTLFDRWADEAVRVSPFPAAKPSQEGRITVMVKRKVANLWEKGICFPDSIPSRFRMADAKRGGPYKWFSHYPSNKTIYTNFEYIVQVAAFHDLMEEYGYAAEWMAFEHHESVPPVAISIDIGIKLPEGCKIFVEVKERKDQTEALISAVKYLGHEGVNLSLHDRGNDPLRKAKSLVAGRPDFFALYSSEGFEAYKITYLAENRFTLNPSDLPHVQPLAGNPPAKHNASKPEGAGVDLIEEMINFLEEGFLHPVKIFQYLQSRGKCLECRIRASCEVLISKFSDSNPWDALEEFFKWCSQWYGKRRYEETIYSVMVLPRVAQYLAESKEWDEPRIRENFKMEFKGVPKKQYDFPVPPCLWKSGGCCIGKIFRGHEMCPDFYLGQPVRLVVEVKVAVPHNSKEVFRKFMEDDINRCKEYLKPETHHYIEANLGIKDFSYALAILIDLSASGQVNHLWKSGIDEEALSREGVFARRISPGP